MNASTSSHLAVSACKGWLEGIKALVLQVVLHTPGVPLHGVALRWPAIIRGSMMLRPLLCWHLGSIYMDRFRVHAPSCAPALTGGISYCFRPKQAILAAPRAPCSTAQGRVNMLAALAGQALFLPFPTAPALSTNYIRPISR